MMSRMDVLTLNYNDAVTTIDFVKRIHNYGVIDSILVVDNKSTDDSYQRLVSELSVYQNVEVVSTKYNGGYGYGNNFGIRYLTERYGSKYILLSNPDVIVEEKAIIAMQKYLAANEDCAIVAPVMTDVNGVKQENTAFEVPSVVKYILSLEWLTNKYANAFRYKNLFQNGTVYKSVGAVSGSMFMMNAEYMSRYGMYDENIFLYCEEVVLGLKMKQAGLNTVLLMDETFIHNHSVSISKSYKSLTKKHALFLKSKLYVIKYYYCANFVQCLFARVLACISKIEIFAISKIKRI